LTLDDGPGRRLTPAVLDLLAARAVTATFFLLGRNIRENQDLVRLIRAQGHEIGSHTYDHLHAWKVAPWRGVSDIRRGFKAIDEALGVEGGRYPFRPAYGKLNLVTLLYLWAKGIPIALWTTDSGDTWRLERSSSDRAAAAVDKAGGGVVLTHDFDRESDETRRYVLSALESTLEVATKRGLLVSTFSQFRSARP
jgi:peptidoglycan/xylan/chitin deacetylase (PgdA/CDA1 family)